MLAGKLSWLAWSGVKWCFCRCLCLLWVCVPRTTQFLPKIYADDDEFIALQCSFVMFRQLMMYHDPELCTVLDQVTCVAFVDSLLPTGVAVVVVLTSGGQLLLWCAPQYDVPPEIYATSWFVTLFARNLDVELVHLLWDFLIVYNHPPLVHCLLLALVEQNRCAQPCE